MGTTDRLSLARAFPQGPIVELEAELPDPADEIELAGLQISIYGGG
jgi:hypothetical protein